MSVDRGVIRLIEIALTEGADRVTSRLAALPAAAPPTVVLAPEVKAFAFLLLDLLIDVRGRLVVIEANGSNAALSSAISGDRPRAAHFVQALLATREAHPEGRIVLLPHAPAFHHVAEFTARALRISEKLEEGGLTWAAAAPGEDIDGAADLTLVIGSIDRLAPHVTVHDRRLRYRELPVALASNANLLPALARLDQTTEVEADVFHDGPLTGFVHDRLAQQELCSGTGFVGLRSVRADDTAAAVGAVASFRADGLGAFVKMNGGSGGNGVVGVGPDMTDAAVGSAIETALSSAAETYGPRVTETAFPLRVFEFAQAQPYPTKEGGHLWDMRVQLLISPGQIEVTPCIVRLCPEPFVGRMDRAAVVANLTGRPATSETLRSPADLLRRIGASEMSECIIEACAEWARAAMAANGSVTTIAYAGTSESTRP